MRSRAPTPVRIPRAPSTRHKKSLGHPSQLSPGSRWQLFLSSFLFERGFDRRTAAKRDLTPLLLSLLGAVVFFIPELMQSSPGMSCWSVIVWSLVAAISGAFSQYARRLHRYDVSSSAIADGVLLSAVLQSSLFLPAMQIQHAPSISDIGWLIIGGGCYFLTNRIANKVFATVAPTEAAVWMSTEPVIALFISVVFLGDLPNYFQFVGGLLLCLASLYTSPTA